MIDRIARYSTLKNISIGFIYILFVNIIAFPLFPKLFSNTSITTDVILDLQFGFSSDFVRESLSIMQEGGRNVYLLSTLIIDIPYAIIYGFVYSFLILFLLKKGQLYKHFKFLVIFPFLISIFDLLENGGIIYLVSSYSEINPTIVKIASVANQLKWIFAFFTIVILLALSVYFFKQKFYKR